MAWRRNGIATVFPQAIGMAATWDTPLLHEVADTIATEARAKHREYIEAHDGDSAQYYGPELLDAEHQIFRDPRWGRGQETYGEDPFLTGAAGGGVHHGIAGGRSEVFEGDGLRKTFRRPQRAGAGAAQFDASRRNGIFTKPICRILKRPCAKGHVGAVMGAYNRVYGVPACASPFLLTDLLRRQWGFDGHVVSDCGADRRHLQQDHELRRTGRKPPRPLAFRAGCDLTAGGNTASLVRGRATGIGHGSGN